MSKLRTITVNTGSRLHFGLWAWGSEHERQFGGVGMMVDQPELKLRLTPAEEFEVTGPVAERLCEVALRCGEIWKLAKLPRIRLDTLRLPRQHSGLGVGTQLNLAIVRGLAEWIGERDTCPASLAAAASRGLRSAVGTHGFVYGGLIVDAGKRENEPLGQLDHRVAIPAEWRVVLITPHVTKGLAGESERRAFANLPPVPTATTERLQQLAMEEIVPAADAIDFGWFADAVYRYGHTSGLCFASLQGGPYASEATCRLVKTLREAGAEGVGQSSWGPTLFAFAPNADAAENLIAKIDREIDSQKHDIVVTAAKNDGATISTVV